MILGQLALTEHETRPVASQCSEMRQQASLLPYCFFCVHKNLLLLTDVAVCPYVPGWALTGASAWRAHPVVQTLALALAVWSVPTLLAV